MKCDIIDLGLTDYLSGDYIQRKLLNKRQALQIPNTIVFAQFSPVFTLGRLGDYKNLLTTSKVLVEKGIKVYKMDRGGDITYHGPGQLVVYPIINLKDYKKDIHLYIRNLEDVIIGFLRKFDISSYRILGKTGVWVDGKKMAQIGIGVSKWTTYHGLSLNINVDKRFFEMIYPCGLKGTEIINLADLIDPGINMAIVKEKILESFSDIFNFDFEYDYISIPTVA